MPEIRIETAVALTLDTFERLQAAEAKMAGLVAAIRQRDQRIADLERAYATNQMASPPAESGAK